MTTNAISQTTPTGSSSSSAASTAASTLSQNTIDYNSFLLLMIQELKNQDPTNPTDPTQYLSQIASFSNVQQTAQSNQSLTSLLTTSSLTQAENVIGKTVTSSDGSTSGVVGSVALGTNGTATATLTNGQTLTLDNTITVSGVSAKQTSATGT